MQVVLTQETEELVKWVLEHGEYGDVSAVLEEAMRAFAEQEFERELFDYAEEALAAHRRGESIPAEDVTLERVKQVADEQERLGLPLPDDAQW